MAQPSCEYRLGVGAGCLTQLEDPHPTPQVVREALKSLYLFGFLSLFFYLAVLEDYLLSQGKPGIDATIRQISSGDDEGCAVSSRTELRWIV